MSLFRKQTTRYFDANGKRVTSTTPDATKAKERSKVWSARYRDADGIVREVKLFRDKTASQQKLNELVRKSELGKAGLVNPHEQHAKTPLAKHLDQFIADLRNRGRTVAHVDLIETRVRSLIGKSKAKFIGDLSASQVQTSLAGLQDEGLSQQTVNHYLRAIKQFSRWLVKDRRTAVDALQHLAGGNVATDRRLERRELTDGELRLLLNAARTGKPSLGLAGWQRFALYATAVGTGLRANELASLTRRSFALTDETATVTIEAAHEKARRGDTLPLPPDLAEMLRPWLATLGADEPLWPGKWAQQKRASKFLQVDLANARQTWLETADDDAQREAMNQTDFLKYRDRDDQQADFHALRHTFLSRLGRSGASAKVMQRLARHSTVELTIGRYTHAGLFDLSAAVNKLPALPMVDQTPLDELQPLHATGTNDQDSLPPIRHSVLVARMVARADEKTGFRVMTADESDADKVPFDRNAKRPENQGVCEPLMTADERRGWDLNPRGTYAPAGFQDRCIRDGTDNQANGLQLVSDLGCTNGCTRETENDRGCTTAESATKPVDAELSKVIDAWPTLPEHLKAAVLALVATAQNSFR